MAGELLTATETPEQPLPANNKFKAKLSNRDRGLALQYAQDGLTQTEIGKRLGVTQSAISQWLSACTDTTADAGLYLRGQALPMAEKIVKQGRPSDLIKALQGVNVLQAEQAGGVTVVIGAGSTVQLNVGLSPSGIEGGGEGVENR